MQRSKASIGSKMLNVLGIVQILALTTPTPNLKRLIAAWRLNQRFQLLHKVRLQRIKLRLNL